jgi:hypothetical protein
MVTETMHRDRIARMEETNTAATTEQKAVTTEVTTAVKEARETTEEKTAVSITMVQDRAKVQTVVREITTDRTEAREITTTVENSMAREDHRARALAAVTAATTEATAETRTEIKTEKADVLAAITARDAREDSARVQEEAAPQGMQHSHRR